MLRKIYYKFKDFIRYKRYKADNNIFDNTVKIGERSILKKTIFGKHSGCNFDCIIVNTIIGNFTNIAWNVCIGARGHIYTNFTTHDFIYTKNEFIPIANNGCFNGYFNKIGHDVWIGCNVTIMPSVEIGNGAIVAAGSIVTKSIPPYAIVGGNPAKFIRWRFTKEQIVELERTEWYEWDIQKIIENKDKLEKIVQFNLDSFQDKYFQKKEYIKDFNE